MKKFAFLFFLSCYCILLSAQESNQPLFREGVNNFYLGYGAGNFSQEFLRDIAGLNNDNNDVSYKTVGPLFIKYEHAFDDKVSMGFNFAYMRNTISYREEGFLDSAYFYNADLSCTTWSILARVNYHIGDNDKIDPYIGLGMDIVQLVGVMTMMTHSTILGKIAHDLNWISSLLFPWEWT